MRYLQSKFNKGLISRIQVNSGILTGKKNQQPRQKNEQRI